MDVYFERNEHIHTACTHFDAMDGPHLRCIPGELRHFFLCW